jgi:uncharacterized protein (PEP-CTERM system associated)
MVDDCPARVTTAVRIRTSVRASLIGRAAAMAGKLMAGMPVLISFAAWAQADAPLGDGPARNFYLTPGVAVQMTATDNVQLSATNKQSDLIAQVIPEVHIGGQSGRLKGFLDYALTASAYAHDRESSNLQNALNASLNAELIESRLFVDANASITQEYLSPFGTQSPDPSLGNTNRTEVSTFDIAPRLAGQIAGEVNYEASLQYGYTSTGTSQAADSSILAGILRFEASTRWSKLSWAATFTYRKIDFSTGNSNFDEFALLSLRYAVTPELRVSVRGNIEASDLTSPERQTTSGWGGGLEWNPSPRTKLFLEEDQRSFGSSHVYGLEYRTPRTVWSISGRQGLSNGTFNGGRGNSGSAFDLLFTQFAAVQPDPVARAQLVTDFMKSNGIAQDTSFNSGYLTDQVTYERRQEASVALMGRRSTVILNAYQTYAKGLAGSPSPPGSQFADGNVLRWRGFGVTLAHQLTPQSTVNLSAAQERTTESVGGQHTNLWTVTGMWFTNLTRRSSLSLSARYSDFSSSTAPYTEAALTANLGMQF